MKPIPRQTRSFLMRRFNEAGINPKTKFGQNFLIDMNLLDLLYSSAEVGPEDVVLEVGGGTGALTQMLAQNAAHVVSVEIDPQMAQLAREELHTFANVTLLEQDALKNKGLMSPLVLQTVQQHLTAGPTPRRFKLAANLPYHVATPIISNLLRCNTPPHSMTVTIQKELADRMNAVPSTKDYSALSVWVQSQCAVEIVRIMPPSVFWPRPKVDSAIIRLVLDPVRRAAIADLDYFHEFVRSMFFHRRKFLRKELLSAFKNRLDKPEIDEILTALGHNPDVRAEQLSLAEMLTLCEATRQALKKAEPETN